MPSSDQLDVFVGIDVATAQLDGKRLAALVGVAPLAHDSGTLRGRRTCWGGRAPVRNALYRGLP